LALRPTAGWFDPCGGWLGWRFWRLVDDALWVIAACPIEGFLSRSVNGISLAVMDLVWRHEADACVVVFVVIPVEELSAEGLGIRAAAKAAWKALLVRQGLEVAFGERAAV